MSFIRLRKFVLAPVALLAAGCGQAPSAPAAAATPAGTQDANLVAAQIADTLQACSYDGTPVQFGMGGQAPRDCRDMIAEVMAFTGLPQNFDVTEADVPNAAAAILLDPQKLPHRVIAFNPEFIESVRRETGGNPWSAVSIMAHEAGHHLAGHTIQPGGSQPPIELEADKFSGFVLYKMGARRDDALTALNALVPDNVPEGSSHPGKRQRIAALSEGWDQACRQTGRDDCVGGTPGSAPAAGVVNRIAQSPVAREGVVGPVGAQADAAAMDADAARPAAPVELPKVVVLPDPDPGALPSKGMQFVYDETGLLDRTAVARIEQAMYEHARTHGVEIVSIVARDFGGLAPDDYAWAMLRQLRVGKLDVGNGAVLVYAPSTRQFGVAIGPGLNAEMKDYVDGYRRGADAFYRFELEQCLRRRGCSGASTDNLLAAADHLRRDTAAFNWEIGFQGFADFHAAWLADAEASAQGARRDDTRTRADMQIVRLRGTVAQVGVPAGERYVNEMLVRDGYVPVKVEGDNGATYLLYLLPQTMALQPAGALQAGHRYAFVARANAISHNLKDWQGFTGFSYDLLH